MPVSSDEASVADNATDTTDIAEAEEVMPEGTPEPEPVEQPLAEPAGDDAEDDEGVPAEAAVIDLDPVAQPAEGTTPSIDPDAPVAVVGIGASAGGVEALTSFTTSLKPTLGMAYVVVPHLSPTQDSHMAQLLARETDLPVVEIEHGMKMQRDRIYVLPPGSMVEVEGDILQLQKRPPGPGHRHVIDVFLKSLSAAYGDRAVAVILSGTLADGRDGVVEVRRGDGYTFAQDVESAEYPEMPRNAIRTGYIDFIMEPRAMGDQLGRLAKHMVTIADGPERVAEPIKQTLFRDVLRLTGIDLSQYKDATLDRRLQRRLVATRSADVESYVSFVAANQDEAARLVEEVLIHVTGFFRDKDVYGTIRDMVLPDLIPDRRTDEPLRIWIPGCATGQEAYSYAILIHEAARKAGVTVDLQIFGTDISSRAIDIARMGIYSESDLEGLNQELRDRYFEKVGESYQVAGMIRSQCIFAVQDVTVDPPFSGMDIVSCRNLLIYLQPDTQRHVTSILHYALKAGGFLVLGDSEALGDAAELFREVSAEARIYARRHGSASRPVRLRAPVRRSLAGTPTTEGGAPAQGNDLRRTAERAMLDGTFHASVIITTQMQIVDMRGDVSKVLRLGHNSNEISLLGSLRSGASNIRKLVQETIRLDGVHSARIQFMQDDGSSIDAMVSVYPMLPLRDHLALTFRRPDDPVSTPAPKASFMGRFFGTDESAQLRRQLRDAEARIDAVVEDYETALEQLRVANEETLSTNEELQSTNEELQTATEESQSAAEELRTLNDELLARNSAVQRVNNDLTNIMGTLEVPVLVLDKKGNIGRFTQGAARLFGVDGRDEGRPLGALRNPFEDVDVAELAHGVARDLQEVRQNVTDADGHEWELRIHPYKSEEARVEGTVVIAMPRS